MLVAAGKDGLSVEVASKVSKRAILQEKPFNLYKTNVECDQFHRGIHPILMPACTAHENGTTVEM